MSTNNSEEWACCAPLPAELSYNDGHTVQIVTYSVLLLISAVGNLTVLSVILRKKKLVNSRPRSRINTMLLHLAIADLMVTFLMMPIEIFWAATVQWILGDTMCKIGGFARIFGLYLSSFVIVCISIDRYLAVLKPMNLYKVDRRGNVMLTTAWCAAIFFSFPQVLIFHVVEHPNFPHFQQCVTWYSFPSREMELAYLYVGMFVMYCFPLLVILFCYTSIVLEIQRRANCKMQPLNCKGDGNGNGVVDFRRSGLGSLGKARIRTVKMTIIIVLVFLICWTPYYAICLWFWIDGESASKADPRLQRGLFLFACTNSCMNPIVYGIFNFRPRRPKLRTPSGKIIAATNGSRLRAFSATATSNGGQINFLPATRFSLKSIE